MVVLAGACVLAGTWQISRFQESVHDNDALRANAHAAPVALSTSLVPLVGHGPPPGRDAVTFRTVTTTGTYLAAAQQFLSGQSSGGQRGVDVVVPFRTAGGTVLVVRGLVPTAAGSGLPNGTADLPAQQVSLTGRLETASTSDDRAGSLPAGQIASINPAQQADRLATPVYQATLVLAAHQPGSIGVVTEPDLSNPAGGAYEAQHFAYILQWYVFAALALVAPFLISRSEVREARRRYLGIDPDQEQLDLAATSDPTDRPPLGAVAESGTLVAVRGTAELSTRPDQAAARRQWAARMATRYGRSLGPDTGTAGDMQVAPLEPDRRPDRRSDSGHPLDVRQAAPSSGEQPHRSDDRYHASYNDYLWELALADGRVPDVTAAQVDVPRATDAPRIEPQVIDPAGSASRQRPDRRTTDDN